MKDPNVRASINFGGWYWVHLLVMVAWSAICLSNATTAFRAGQAGYGLIMAVLAGLGVLLLIAWYPLQDRRPTAEDRLRKYPLVVLGLFDAIVFGGGILIQDTHARMVPGSAEPSVLSVVIGGVLILIGISYVRGGLDQRRQMRQKAEQDSGQKEDSDD